MFFFSIFDFSIVYFTKQNYGPVLNIKSVEGYCLEVEVGIC